MSNNIQEQTETTVKSFSEVVFSDSHRLFANLNYEVKEFKDSENTYISTYCNGKNQIDWDNIPTDEEVKDAYINFDANRAVDIAETYAMEGRAISNDSLFKELYSSIAHSMEEVKDDIAIAISKFDGKSTKSISLSDVMDKWGKEPVAYIIANSLMQHLNDGRINSKTMDWAKTVVSEVSHDWELILNANAGLLDSVSSQVINYNPIASVEELEEGNYNMIDGIPNNGFGEKNNIDNESNFRIKCTEDEHYFVISDSERFGTDEIVFQGISYAECLNYIDERVESEEPSYYVIKDLASWRSDVWDEEPEYSKVERFDNIEDAIDKFLEYRAMDYLKDNLINPDNNEPMRRLALGVSLPMRELDLLHVANDETMLISDVVAQKEKGFDGFMVNSNFISDLNYLLEEIEIEKYSFYKEPSFDDIVNDKYNQLKKNESDITKDEVINMTKNFLKTHPNYQKQHMIHETILFKDYKAPFINNKKSMFTKESMKEDLAELSKRKQEIVKQTGCKTATKEQMI